MKDDANSGEPLVSQRLGDRFAQHLRSIRNNTSGSPVAEHFNLPGHTLQHVKVCGLYKATTFRDRKSMEMRYIFGLKTIKPNGLNIRFKFT